MQWSQEAGWSLANTGRARSTRGPTSSKFPSETHPQENMQKSKKVFKGDRGVLQGLFIAHKP